MRALLCALTGAEDATLVNNNAAAVLLVPQHPCERPRGYRLAGRVDRDRRRVPHAGHHGAGRAQGWSRSAPPTAPIPKDYTAGAQRADRRRSSRSIPRTTASRASPPRSDAATLAAIAGAANVALINDLGSGTLVDLSPLWAAEGADGARGRRAGRRIWSPFPATSCSADPQAGFIVGRRELIAAVNRNPMKRALRVDKIRLAAIEATLKLYRDPDRLAERLPTLRLLARPLAEIEAQARRLLPAVAARRRRRLHRRGLRMPQPDRLRRAAARYDRQRRPRDPSASRKRGARAAWPAALRGLDRPVIGRIEDGAPDSRPALP